ncbi:hypothetical protein BN1013_02215 [Candidatus Rubidus massiliensis]|nr:hypothetical protein BN1013_02215 [Candidatus Rubidus massiliensis]
MKNNNQQLNENLAELAWSLWTELGVLGNIRRHSHTLIHLEELIILTAVIGNYDPRLREEALDWCSSYHHFVSLSRLKSLVKKLGPSIFEPYSIFATSLNKIASSNWPTFTEVLPIKFVPSKKSVLPTLSNPALLQLRLRSFFGVGARADLFTRFLIEMEDSFTASDVLEIGYSKRSLADILDSLTLSGFLIATKDRNQKKYELVKVEQFKSLIGELPQFCPPWNRILQVLISLHFNLNMSENSSHFSKTILLPKELEKNKNILKSIHLSLPIFGNDLNKNYEYYSKWLLDWVKSISRGNFGSQFKSKNNFEIEIISLIQLIYRVVDCLDGLEFVHECSKESYTKHSEIYKETYLLSLELLKELKENLEKLLAFPFYRLMDNKILEIQYEYINNNLQNFFIFVENYISLKQVENPNQALKQYNILQGELNKLNNFISILRSRLSKIYFFRTNINLLMQPSELFKRHIVLKLYSNN